MNAKAKWLALALLVLAFLGGAASGAAIVHRAWLRKTHHPHPEVGLKIREDRHLEHLSERMETLLDLSPEQNRLVREELQRVGRDFRSLHERTRSEMQEIRDQGHQAILRHLDATQKERFEEWASRKNERFRDGRRRMPAPGPMPSPEMDPGHRGSDVQDQD
jgi:DNA anti-recombination protein RmuC